MRQHYTYTSNHKTILKNQNNTMSRRRDESPCTYSYWDVLKHPLQKKRNLVAQVGSLFPTGVFQIVHHNFIKHSLYTRNKKKGWEREKKMNAPKLEYEPSSDEWFHIPEHDISISFIDENQEDVSYFPAITVSQSQQAPQFRLNNTHSSGRGSGRVICYAGSHIVVTLKQSSPPLRPQDVVSTVHHRLNNIIKVMIRRSMWW